MKKMINSIITFIFILICILSGILMAMIGYGIGTWQWWLGTSCVCVSYIIGFAKGIS